MRSAPRPRPCKLLARAKPINGGVHLQLSPSLITSPMYQATSGARYRGRANWNAGRAAAVACA